MACGGKEWESSWSELQHSRDQAPFEFDIEGVMGDRIIYGRAALNVVARVI